MLVSIAEESALREVSRGLTRSQLADVKAKLSAVNSISVWEGDRDFRSRLRSKMGIEVAGSEGAGNGGGGEWSDGGDS
jgi:hypothetical protein